MLQLNFGGRPAGNGQPWRVAYFDPAVGVEPVRWLRQWGSRSTKWQDAFKRLQGQPDLPRLCNAMIP